MKKYMMITLYEGQQGVSFYDSYDAAFGAHMDAECGLGAYAEVYERQDGPEGGQYVLLYA